MTIETKAWAVVYRERSLRTGLWTKWKMSPIYIYKNRQSAKNLASSLSEPHAQCRVVCVTLTAEVPE